MTVAILFALAIPVVAGLSVNAMQNATGIGRMSDTGPLTWTTIIMLQGALLFVAVPMLWGRQLGAEARRTIPSPLTEVERALRLQSRFSERLGAILRHPSPEQDRLLDQLAHDLSPGPPAAPAPPPDVGGDSVMLSAVQRAAVLWALVRGASMGGLLALLSGALPQLCSGRRPAIST